MLSALVPILGMVAVWAPAARAEDLTIVFRTMGQGGEQTATHYFTSTRVRLDQGEEATIVDFSTGTVVSVSLKKKQYAETTFAEIERAMTSMSAEMEKAMAGIPESLRSKMMGDAAKEVTVTKGESRTVAGVPCQNYIVSLGGKSRMEACATTAIQPPFDPGNFRNLALVTFPIGPGNSGLNKMVAKMRAIQGLSLASSASLSILGRKIETSSEATEIRKGPIDASTFEIPRNLTKVDSPFAKMAR